MASRLNRFGNTDGGGRGSEYADDVGFEYVGLARYVRTGESVQTLPEVLEDGRSEPVDHPSRVMRKEL